MYCEFFPSSSSCLPPLSLLPFPPPSLPLYLSLVPPPTIFPLPSYLPVHPLRSPPCPSSPLTSLSLLPSYLPPPALAEARDISMHLNPLRKHFEAMEEMEYLELPKQFPAVFHLICLVWSHSTHYQQPARVIVLLQEIANLLILLVRWLTSEPGL